MDIETARAALEQQLAQAGEPVVLSRPVANQPAIEVAITAFCRGYKPQEIAAGIMAGESQVTVSHDSLVGFPAPIKTGDFIRYQGRNRRVMNVQAVKLGDAFLRYDLRVST